jgi:hypothetical protein
MQTNRAIFILFLATKLAEQSSQVPIITNKSRKEAFSFDNGMVKVAIPFSSISDFVNRRKSKKQQVHHLQLINYQFTNVLLTTIKALSKKSPQKQV